MDRGIDRLLLVDGGTQEAGFLLFAWFGDIQHPDEPLLAGFKHIPLEAVADCRHTLKALGGK